MTLFLTHFFLKIFVSRSDRNIFFLHFMVKQSPESHISSSLQNHFFILIEWFTIKAFIDRDLVCIFKVQYGVLIPTY